MARHFFLLCLKNKEKTLINNIIEVMTYHFLRRNWSNSLGKPKDQLFLSFSGSEDTNTLMYFQGKRPHKTYGLPHSSHGDMMSLCSYSESSSTTAVRKTAIHWVPLFKLTIGFGKTSIKPAGLIQNSLKEVKARKRQVCPVWTQGWKCSF